MISNLLQLIGKEITANFDDFGIYQKDSKDIS